MNDLATAPIGAFLDGLAAKTPTPGGGAVAALTGATAAALGQMVLAYSIGKKDLAEHQPALEADRGQLQRARGLFLALAEEDAAAYRLLNELQRLPAEDARRKAEMGKAVEASIGAPMACLAAACDLLRLFEPLPPKTNKFLRSDLAIAAMLAETAARAAAENVKINLPLLTDDAQRAAKAAAVAEMLAGAASRQAAVVRACG
ncbi:MAG: cyclodeaminase/cyclohydrolase family protein [Planctomycetaceae bacterium]|jgi:formiminotetrahydrofolate cyclodeaminase|nr:cyclodeaminase/cyclohydrolase family protein [Phycisphaerales bacterium]MCE2652116.1 cyclodeaminase/cyclohydrolase family protein [Planctomycetaceae bacterium]